MSPVLGCVSSTLLSAIFPKMSKIRKYVNAGMAKLAAAPDLGSGVERRGDSTSSTCTKNNRPNSLIAKTDRYERFDRGWSPFLVTKNAHMAKLVNAHDLKSCPSG